MSNFFDIHCHILPGVDDGADTMREAMAMLKRLYMAGVTNIILTPHFREGIFEPKEEVIHHRFIQLKRYGEEKFPGLKLYLGCEFHSNMDMSRWIKERTSLTMANSSYILLEFSKNDSAMHMKDQVYNLLSLGYTPIIAHVERYDATLKNMNTVRDLVRIGAMMQVNADSILGKEGWKTKIFCKQLMKEDLLSFVGSDAHHIKTRSSHMGECMTYVTKKMGKDYTNQIFHTNPSKIVNT